MDQRPSGNFANEQYVRYSEQTSATVRTLALGGIAILWLYKPEKAPDVLGGFANRLVDQPMLLSTLLLFVIALALDVVQYGLASFKWRRYQIMAETLADTDNYSLNLPTGVALKKWSSRLGREFAAYVVSETAKINTTIVATISTSSPDDLVWLARRITFDPAAYGISDSQLGDIFTRGWTPSVVTRSVNGLYWLKLGSAVGGYALLVASIVNGLS